MPFLTLSNTDISFLEQELIWKSYTIAKLSNKSNSLIRKKSLKQY